MIDAIVAGKLFGSPETKTAKTGRAFTTAKVRAATAEGESIFVNVIAFSDTAQAALQALGAGDACSVAGSIKPTAWTDRSGNARPALDMVAAQVMTAYTVSRKRRAMQPEQDDAKAPQRQQVEPDFDDSEVPF